MARLLAFGLAWGLVLGLGTGARAQTQLIRVDAQGPVDVRAEQVEYDERTTTYRAEGEVEITRGFSRIIADRVQLNAKTLIAEATGRVRLISPDQVLTGDRILIDLQGNTGKVYNGQVFVRANNFYLRGEEIEKTGKDTYRMNQGSFTTCDGSEPAWEFSGQDMEVTLEGYGTAKNTALKVRDVPLLWSPYMVFPAKFQRQSGFMPPQFGQSSRDGTVISQSYFQTLGDDEDMTFTVNYMSSRGVDLGGEYRYNLGPGSKGMFMIDYLPKDLKGESLYKEGELDKPYDSRYWFRAKVDQIFYNDMELKVNLDIVSDRDYLREFSFGDSGFDASNQRFLQWFGRELDPSNSTIRENKINLLKSWTNTTFNGTLRYYDDLSSDNRSTLQELPYLSLDAISQPVGETGLYFKMGASYYYYYREVGSTGQIADLSPTLSLPLNFNDYLTLEPSISYQPRLYAVSKDVDETGDPSTEGMSNIWSFATTASTYLYRVYDLGSAADPVKVKHAVRPYTTYSFQPNQWEQDVASLASRSDTRTNNISYGLENSFTSKMIGQDEDTGEWMALYQEFMRANLGHSFNLDKYRKGGDTQYWGDFEGKLEFEPNRFLYFQTVASWDPYNNVFNGISNQLIASNRRGDELLVDYLTDSAETNQIRSRLKLKVTKDWSVRYINHHDLETDQDFENTYELRYEAQCWGLRFFYMEKPGESGYYMAFALGGFGELFGYGQTRRVSDSTD